MKVINIPRDSSEINDLMNSGYDQESINKKFQDDLEDIAKEYMIMTELKGNANIIYSEDIYHEKNPEGIGYQLFIKMELLQPLKNVISNPASAEQVIKLGIDMCNALTACRKHNIIHRDIKPENILVSNDGNFKLGDFGVSKTAEHTAGGTKTGTYKYMAPEVYNNKPYGAAVDIYSLGMVLYYLLNRQRAPFVPVMDSKVPTSKQLDEANQRRFKGDTLPPPVDGNPALHKIVLKACAFRAEDRYSSPEEMRSELIALKEQKDSTVTNESTSAFAGEKTADTTADANAWTDADSEKTMGNDWGHTDEKTVGTECVRDDAASGGTVGNEKATGRQQAASSANVTVKIEITPEEAQSGCKKTVAVEGKQYSVTVPAGTTDGQVLRLNGAGKTDTETGAKGDALITVYIKKAAQNFWEKGAEHNKNAPYDQEAVISTAEARAGKELEVGGRKINIPAGTTDGDVVDSVKIYVHDFNTGNRKTYLEHLNKLDKLPNAVLEGYVARGEKKTILGNLWNLVVVPIIVIISTVIFYFLMEWLNDLHDQLINVLIVVIFIIAFILCIKVVLLSALTVISLPVLIPIFIIDTKRDIKFSKKAKEILEERKK